MSKEIDYDNLTEDDVEYLRQRTWMKQPSLEQLAALGLEAPAEDGTDGLDDTDQSNVEVVDLTGIELKTIVEPDGDDEDDGELDDDDPSLVADPDDITFEEDDEPSDEVNEQYADLEVEQLRYLCRDRSLSDDGNEDELRSRLESDDEAR